MTIPKLNDTIVEFLEKEKQEKIEKIYPIIEKYINYFNEFARCEANAGIKEVDANITKEPYEFIEKNYIPSIKERFYSSPCMLNLKLKISIKYTQDCNQGASFYRIEELEYELSKLLGSPQYFSTPEFLYENNVGMTNHSNTWKIECLLKFSRELTYDDFQKLF